MHVYNSDRDLDLSICIYIYIFINSFFLCINVCVSLAGESNLMDFTLCQFGECSFFLLFDFILFPLSVRMCVSSACKVVLDSSSFYIYNCNREK